MKFTSWLVDKKISGLNVSVEMTIEEYWGFAPKILDKNDLQRRRVKAKGKTYELLSRDLLEGCIMPPIILAVNENQGKVHEDKIKESLEAGYVSEKTEEELEKFIKEVCESAQLIILDGLQRTYTIRDSIIAAKSKDTLDSFNKQKIRAEVYLGLSKLGILYRMITLNTGQNPMTLRHQIEMLYQDQIEDDEFSNHGIVLTREVEEIPIRNSGQYRYADVADMYHAFTTGEPLSHNKQTITTILQENEFLETFDLTESETMKSLILVYDKLAKLIHANSSNWSITERLNKINDLENSEEEQETNSEDEILGRLKNIAYPFGKNTISIFSKVQVMAGFGAACSKLKKNLTIKNLDEVNEIIDKITFENIHYYLDLLITLLDEIKLRSNRVGDSQRAFFTLFFQRLLNPNFETPFDFSKCIISAKHAYDSLY